MEAPGPMSSHVEPPLFRRRLEDPALPGCSLEIGRLNKKVNYLKQTAHQHSSSIRRQLCPQNCALRVLPYEVDQDHRN